MILCVSCRWYCFLLVSVRNQDQPIRMCVQENEFAICFNSRWYRATHLKCELHEISHKNKTKMTLLTETFPNVGNKRQSRKTKMSAKRKTCFLFELNFYVWHKSKTFFTVCGELFVRHCCELILENLKETKAKKKIRERNWNSMSYK